jgi:hypothetical protein
MTRNDTPPTRVEFQRLKADHGRLTPPSKSFGSRSSTSPMQAILGEERRQNMAAEPNPVIRQRS